MIKPRNIVSCLLSFGLLAVLCNTVVGQEASKSYAETRKLLLKMERTDANGTMKKLFEQGIRRKADLIRAIDDEQKVSVNAQVIINYLSDTEMLAAISSFCEKRIQQKPGFSMPKMTLVTETTILKNNGKDLTDLVLKSIYPSNDCKVTLIGFNKDNQTALIEVVEGNVFTTGYHVSLRKEGDGWRLLSNNLIWNS